MPAQEQPSCHPSNQVMPTTRINEPNLDSSLRMGSNTPRRLKHLSISNRSRRSSQHYDVPWDRIACRNLRASRSRVTLPADIGDDPLNGRNFRSEGPRRNFPMMLVRTMLSTRHSGSNFNGKHSFMNPVCKRPTERGVTVPVGNKTQYPRVSPKENATRHITTLLQDI